MSVVLTGWNIDSVTLVAHSMFGYCICKSCLMTCVCVEERDIRRSLVVLPGNGRNHHVLNLVLRRIFCRHVKKPICLASFHLK